MKRRSFLKYSFAFSLLKAHDHLGCGNPLNSQNDDPKILPLIRSLELETNHSISALSNFYAKKLGLKIIKQKNNYLSIAAGKTILNFKRTDNEIAPFYHFAFNIPENKIRKALTWQSKRTRILPSPSHMIDPKFPKSIRHFRNWNAHSIFFWDPAGNLLEYIARHVLPNHQAGDFSSKDLLYISEIAFILEEVEPTKTLLQDNLKLQQYKDGSDQFKAMGDESGLLLLMKKGRIWMWHTSEAKTTAIFPVKVGISSKLSSSLIIPNHPFEVFS